MFMFVEVCKEDFNWMVLEKEVWKICILELIIMYKLFILIKIASSYENIIP